MSGKKSQVTVFFIIGIVIFASTGLFIYYKTSTQKEVAMIESEAQPVREFIETCMSTISREALATIGFNGGFLNLPVEIGKNPRTYLPTMASSPLKTPYWWYDSISNVPSEDFIIAQLEDEMDKELPKCISNFEQFGKEFKVIELGQLNSEVLFTKEGVLFKVDYPIEIVAQLNRTKTKLNEFNVNTPVRFKAVYDMAKQIMERENIDMFIEKKAIDLMAMDTEIPTTDIEATCTQRTWELDEVKSKIKTLLRVNLPYIRIANTEYDSNAFVPQPDDKSTYADSYYNYHYIWKISDEKYKNMHVSFTYDDNWPLDIHARPSDGNLLKSNSQKSFDVLSFFCLHIWHFTYDMSFPVKVTIVDEQSKDHSRYVFTFAFRTAIDHNTPVRGSLAANVFRTPERLTSEEYCKDEANDVVILTDDNATNEALPDVNVTFICGRYACNLGSSEWISFGAAAGISRRMPSCVNAVIKGSKEGYAESKMFIQTDMPGRDYALKLKPVKKFTEYEVVKHPVEDPGFESPLDSNERATILLKAKDGYETFGLYPAEGYPITLPAKAESVFDVNIYIIRDDEITGGYSGEWTILPGEIDAGSKIVFHAVDQRSFLNDDERLLFLTGMKSYSEKIPKPELR